MRMRRRSVVVMGRKPGRRRPAESSLRAIVFHKRRFTCKMQDPHLSPVPVAPRGWPARWAWPSLAPAPDAGRAPARAAGTPARAGECCTRGAGGRTGRGKSGRPVPASCPRGRRAAGSTAHTAHSRATAGEELIATFAIAGAFETWTLPRSPAPGLTHMSLLRE